MKILIADDSLYCRLLTRRLIEQAEPGCCEFAFAGDGEQAMAVIQSGGVDILITDLIMPVKDGLELLRMIKAEPRHRPGSIFVMTSAITPTLRAMLAMFGVDWVINKPLTQRSLGEAFAHLSVRAETR